MKLRRVPVFVRQNDIVTCIVQKGNGRFMVGTARKSSLDKDKSFNLRFGKKLALYRALGVDFDIEVECEIDGWARVMYSSFKEEYMMYHVGHSVTVKLGGKVVW